MYAHDELMTIIEEVDVLVAELRELNESGPHFRIVHRFHVPGTDCAPGEEVAAVYLVYRGQEYHLRLSLALLLLFDYLARHTHLPQSATQIEAGMRAKQLYQEHAANARSTQKFTRSIPRSYIRVYISRLQLAIEEVLRRAELSMDPCAVLITQDTVTNEVLYSLKAIFEWRHTDV